MINNLPRDAKGVAEIINGILVGDNVCFDSITTDTRDDNIKNSCFIALDGNNYQGHLFINEAIEKGARLIITNKRIQTNATTIYVDDTINALGMLGKNNKKNARIIGITGSVGKTTTKEMIISVLSQKYSVCGTYSNENNEIGVAKTLISIKNEEFCVIEMGMRKKGEIEYLSSLAEPNISVITNCGEAHLKFFKNKDEIFKSKTEILKYTKESILIPNEDRFKRIDYGKVNPIFLGEEGDYVATNVRCADKQLVFDVAGKDCCINDVCINTIYAHNVNNALYAVTIAKILRIEDDLIKKGLIKYQKSRLREETIFINGAEVILDCYNACYESMKNAILSFSSYAKKQKKRAILLLGDMLELGENSCIYHYKIGELAKKCNIDKLYLYGDYAVEYKRGFGAGAVFEEYDILAKNLNNELSDKTVLLVKASRHLAFEKILDKLRE